MSPTLPVLSRQLCTSCGATPGGCLSLHTLAGRPCCARCTHPIETNRRKS